MPDPAMSPAQKIRKALAERYCCEPDDIPRSMSEMESVACIVIRAAADEIKMPKNPGLWGNAYWAGVTGAETKLRAIAAELEAQL